MWKSAGILTSVACTCTRCSTTLLHATTGTAGANGLAQHSTVYSFEDPMIGATAQGYEHAEQHRTRAARERERERAVCGADQRAHAVRHGTNESMTGIRQGLTGAEGYLQPHASPQLLPLGAKLRSQLALALGSTRASCLNRGLQRRDQLDHITSG